MSKFVNITLVALAALLFCVYIEARATPTTVSLLDDMQLSYNHRNSSWRCDLMYCPKRTLSCRMTRWTDANSTVIIRTSYCYGTVKTSTQTVQFESDMVSPENIDIDIKSFLGVSTDLIYGYTNNSQTVNGTVMWEDWPNVQQQYRGIILEASQNQSAYYRGY